MAMPNSPSSSAAVFDRVGPEGRARSKALAAFRRAVSASPGYRQWLVRAGVDPETVSDIDEVPYLAKPDVFSGSVSDWIEGGRAAEAAELLTSSGRGGAFSIGVSSRAEQLAVQATTDTALRAAGANEHSTTLLLNCLPMGINVTTALATVAMPSVNLEMAQEIYERLGPDFDRVIILSEPLFLKEFAERLYADHGAAWSATQTNCIVGGEWVSEPWRAYVGSLFGMPDPSERSDDGILISMGAAELGLNLLFETPELRALRSMLDDGDRGAELVERDHGYTPSLFAFDPDRLFVEEREHPNGSTTLAFTPLDRRLLPLVRYDLGDMAEIVPAERVNVVLERHGSPTRFATPVIAFWGRHSDRIAAGETTIRPERIKQRLFSFAAEAAVLTGRFYLDPAPALTLHLQLRPNTIPTPRLASDLSSFLGDVARSACRVEIHPHDDYPFHAAGDYQHKPIYHSVT